MKGVYSVAVSLVFVSVFREAYDRTKPTEEGRASALRGRLVQSVDPTKLNNALAPRAAGRRGEPACALASAVASDEDWTR